MTIATIRETRTAMDNVRWETYLALCNDRGDAAIPQLTFDRGLLELMSPKKDHEKVKTLLGLFVMVFAEEREIDIESAASTTFHRQDLERGFEADESFYIEHAELIRGKDEVDLSTDPPPELVIEVEMTRSAIRKLELFAAMGVQEVWRHDGSQLSVHVLADGEFGTASDSQVLRGFPVENAESLVRQRRQRGEIQLMQDFRKACGQ